MRAWPQVRPSDSPGVPVLASRDPRTACMLLGLGKASYNSQMMLVQDPAVASAWCSKPGNFSRALMFNTMFFSTTNILLSW
jgi:hypothetical protein